MRDATTTGAVDARDLAARAHLERIAAVLGCPVAAFFTGEGAPAGLASRRELLALWGALRTDASRDAVLKLVRAIGANA